MQRRKLMVCRRHKLHKMLMHHLRIGTVERALHIGINYALLFNLLTHIVVNKLRVILRTYTGKARLLCLRNTQTLEGVLNILGNILPLALHLGIRTHVGNDVFHIQAFNRRSPLRHLNAVINLQGFQTELAHPLWIVLFTRNLLNNFTRQALADAISVLILVTEVVKTSVYIFYIGFFFHLYSTSYSLFWINCSKPFLLTSSTSSGPAFLIIWPCTRICVLSTCSASRIFVLCVIISKAP